MHLDPCPPFPLFAGTVISYPHAVHLPPVGVLINVFPLQFGHSLPAMIILRYVSGYNEVRKLLLHRHGINVVEVAYGLIGTNGGM